MRKKHVFYILSFLLVPVGCLILVEWDIRLTDDYVIIDTGTIIKPLLREFDGGGNATLIGYVTAYGITEDNIYIINFPRLDEHKGNGPLDKSIKESFVCEYYVINHISHSIEEYSKNEWINLYKKDVFNIETPLRNLHYLPNRRYCYDETVREINN